MAIITFVTFSHSNNYYVCHKLNNYFTLISINHFINYKITTIKVRTKQLNHLQPAQETKMPMSLGCGYSGLHLGLEYPQPCL